LEEEQGIKARTYLTQRGISEQTAKIFNLGFAPDGWDNLFRFLISRGVAPELIEQAGLTLPRQEKSDTYYDRFRSRLIFPISDLRGKVIAFSGRTLTQEEPKYLNSPETPLYRKGETFYGLNLTKEEIKKANYVILVEGNLDLLSLYQAGFRNVAAPLGTALTSYQCKLLVRFTDKVILAFDADAAGSAAMERSAELLRQEGLSVKVAELEGAKDPDELIHKSGAKALEQVLAKALPFLSFKIKRALAKYHLNEIEARAKAVREVAGILSLEKDPFIQKEYIKIYAETLKTEEESLAAEVKRQKFYQQKLEKDLRRIIEKPPSKLAQAEKSLIALALQDPKALIQIQKELKAEDFSQPETREIARLLFAENLEKIKDPAHFILDHLSDESAKKMVAKILVEELPICKDKTLTDCIKVIKKEHLSRQIDLLKIELRKAEKAGETQRVAELLNLLKNQTAGG
jgi:DNA primase